MKEELGVTDFLSEIGVWKTSLKIEKTEKLPPVNQRGLQAF